MKNLFTVLLTIAFFFGFNISISDASTESNMEEDFTWEVIEESDIEDNEQPLNTYGVSHTNPDITFTPYGVSRPSNVWDVSSKGQYNFSGTSTIQTLYTNYKFKGKTSYTIKVTNHGKNELTVKAKRVAKTYATTKVAGGKSATIQFSSIKKDTEFYITFDGNYQNFSGNIK